MEATLIRPKAERHSAAGGDPAAAVQASIVNGTQALLALLIAQRRRDRAGGLSTAAFVSGYRGSPLGRLDQLLGQQQSLLKRWDIEFLPAINEEFAATACLGAQRVALDPRRRVDGVHCLWYGKGPGLDRAGDALRHGHVYGSSRLGGVLVVVGEDHGVCIQVGHRPCAVGFGGMSSSSSRSTACPPSGIAVIRAASSRLSR